MDAADSGFLPAVWTHLGVRGRYLPPLRGGRCPKGGWRCLPTKATRVVQERPYWPNTTLVARHPHPALRATFPRGAGEGTEKGKSSIYRDELARKCFLPSPSVNR